MRKWQFYAANEIKPQGWLLRQLRIQAEGLSGNLDKVWPDIRDSAWIGGSREGWERVPYWLDGFIPLAYLLDDQDMIARAQKYINAIMDRQQPDGWICPCTESERKTYDTWAIQLMTKVLTVYYTCSKDERVPPVIYKTLKNYYELLKNGDIELFEWGKFRWFELFISLNMMYERCHEPWLIELGRLVKKQGADYADYVETWKRPLNKWTFHTHIVNLAMMLKSEAVSCDLLGDDYTDLAQRFHDILKAHNGTAVEAFTGDECLGGLSPIQGTELCAVVEQMYSYELLYAYTGDSKWAQRLEVLAFNALPATISEDMWTHQYVQMNNQIACETFPGKAPFRTNGPEAHLFGLEPHYGCCTANFNQGWPKFALSAFMHGENTVINALPVPCQLKTDEISITLETDYPFENNLHYVIDSKKDFTFRLRLPKEASDIQVNGQAVDAEALSFSIRQGEHRELAVTFGLAPRLMAYGYDMHWVQQGSLVFSLPIQYEKRMREYERNGVKRQFPYCDYELIPRSAWNYGLTASSFKAEYKGVGAIPFSENEPPVVLNTAMQKIDWGLEDGYETVCAKIPQSRVGIAPAQTMTLIPYGCAKLRMTVFPMVD